MLAWKEYVNEPYVRRPNMRATPTQRSDPSSACLRWDVFSLWMSSSPTLGEDTMFCLCSQWNLLWSKEINSSTFSWTYNQAWCLEQESNSSKPECEMVSITMTIQRNIYEGFFFWSLLVIFHNWPLSGNAGWLSSLFLPKKALTNEPPLPPTYTHRGRRERQQKANHSSEWGLDSGAESEAAALQRQ